MGQIDLILEGNKTDSSFYAIPHTNPTYNNRKFVESPGEGAPAFHDSGSETRDATTCILEIWEQGVAYPRLSELNRKLTILKSNTHRKLYSTRRTEAARALRWLRIEIDHLAECRGIGY